MLYRAVRQRTRWLRFPAAWVWLGLTLVSWVLVVLAGYGLMALAVHLTGR
jgi:hypothetical protein